MIARIGSLGPSALICVRKKEGEGPGPSGVRREKALDVGTLGVLRLGYYSMAFGSLKELRRNGGRWESDRTFTMRQAPML